MVKKELIKKASISFLVVMLAASPVMAAVASGSTYTQTDAASDGNYSYDTPASPAKRSHSSGSDGNGSNTPVPVVMYNKTTIGGVIMTSTVPGTYLETAVNGVAVLTPLADVATALGLANADYLSAFVTNTACGEGTYSCLDNFLSTLAPTIPNIVKGPMIDFRFRAPDANGNFVNLYKSAGPVSVSIGLPDSFIQTDMDYAVVVVEADGTTVLFPNVGSDPYTVIFNLTSYGTLTLVKAPAGSFDSFR